MWLTKGQDSTISHLAQVISAARQPHAYLILGPQGSGKSRLALDIFKAVNCTSSPGDPCLSCPPCDRAERGVHQDAVRVHRQDTPNIGIAPVKEALDRLYITSSEGGHSAVFIHGAHLMTPDAANALLKTLEEPPHKSLVILLSEDAHATLPTVRSRCHLIQMEPSSMETLTRIVREITDVDHQTAQDASIAADGWIGRAITLATDPEQRDQRHDQIQTVRNAAMSGVQGRFAAAAAIDEAIRSDRSTGAQLLSHWQSWWRDRMVESLGAPHLARNPDLTSTASLRQTADALQAAEEAIVDLQANAHPRTTIERMMLRTPTPTGQNP